MWNIYIYISNTKQVSFKHKENNNSANVSHSFSLPFIHLGGNHGNTPLDDNQHLRLVLPPTNQLLHLPPPSLLCLCPQGELKFVQTVINSAVILIATRNGVNYSLPRAWIISPKWEKHCIHLSGLERILIQSAVDAVKDMSHWLVLLFLPPVIITISLN